MVYIRSMRYSHRLIEQSLAHHLERGKSILLLGPRQTGKTTLIEQCIRPDISYSFVQASVRQRYEKNPELLERELQERIQQHTGIPIVFIDEVQKIPRVMDVAQYFIDRKQARFILTGSSARKLRRGSELNLLPGRVVVMTMPPFVYEELPSPAPNLEELLIYGTLPHIVTEEDPRDRETDLYSYVTTYLEQEVRAEALVRNVGNFARFLEIAAGEAGRQLNFTRLSQDIGVADTTIAHYFQILEDCLITLRIDPITNTQTKRRLIKSPKYLFFDLGIRRACAKEGIGLPQRVLTDLFEHFVGNQLVYLSRLYAPNSHIRYWRDVAGPEIDYVIDMADQYIPIEVKWSDKPTLSDARHLMKFIQEYSDHATQAYIVCRTPYRYKLADNVTVISWKEIKSVFDV